MDEGSLHPRRRIQEFFGSIAERYDLANHLLSAGCDFLWRRHAARLVAGWNPARILDLATGSGDLALDLRRALPESVIVARISACRCSKSARQGSAAAGGGRCPPSPFRRSDFRRRDDRLRLRNMESWNGALREVARVLRPGGRLLVLDFSVPPPPLRWVYRPYLHHVLPAVAALVTGRRAVYQYLADSIERFPAGENMAHLLRESGLHCRDQIPLQGGIVSLHVAEKEKPLPDANG